MRWAASLLLGVPSVLLILLNWLVVVGAAMQAARRGRSHGISFCPPFLCGLACAVACLACPLPGVWRWAWVPPLVDPSIGLLLLASVLHVLARVSGRPSPFDDEPPPRPDEQIHG